MVLVKQSSRLAVPPEKHYFYDEANAAKTCGNRLSQQRKSFSATTGSALHVLGSCALNRRVIL